MLNDVVILAGSTVAVSPRPSVEQRAPLVLPVCNSCPTPISYDKVLPWAPPQTRDVLRTNAWSITVPGLPFLPGITSSKQPQRYLSYLAPLYGMGYHEQWLIQACKDGYTHQVLSYPDIIGRGWTLDSFKAVLKMGRDYGMWNHCKVWSKDFPNVIGANLQPDQFMAEAQPIFDRLDGLVDEYGVWEWDSNNIAGSVSIEILAQLGEWAHEQGASFWYHGQAGNTSWQAPGQGRDAFWIPLFGHVDGLDYQSNQYWDIGQLQSHMVDTLGTRLFATLAAQGKPFKMRLFETLASLQFDNAHPDEDESDAYNYAALCTSTGTDGQYLWGGGGGLRMPDGWPY